MGESGTFSARRVKKAIGGVTNDPAHQGFCDGFGSEKLNSDLTGCRGGRRSLFGIDRAVVINRQMLAARYPFGNSGRPDVN
jgi:hypothetical protein